MKYDKYRPVINYNTREDYMRTAQAMSAVGQPAEDAGGDCGCGPKGPLGLIAIPWAPMLMDQREQGDCGQGSFPTVFDNPVKSLTRVLDITQRRPSAFLSGSFSLETIFNGYHTADGDLKVSGTSTGASLGLSLAAAAGTSARGCVVELTFSQPLETLASHEASVALSFVAFEDLFAVRDSAVAVPNPTTKTVSFNVRLPNEVGDRKVYVVLHKRIGDATVPVQALVQSNATPNANDAALAVSVTGLVSTAAVSVTASLCVPGTSAWRRLIGTIANRQRLGYSMEASASRLSDRNY